MTYKEKLQQDFKGNNIKELMMESCPGHYYTVEPYEKCNPLKCSVCKECWNREMPQEELDATDDTTPTYEQGLNDMWELIGKFISLDERKQKEYFGVTWVSELLENFTPQQALARMVECENAVIKVGDIVEFLEEEKRRGWVTSIKSNACYGIFSNGSIFAMNISECKKLDKYLDLAPIFNVIKGE